MKKRSLLTVLRNWKYEIKSTEVLESAVPASDEKSLEEKIDTLPEELLAASIRKSRAKEYEATFLTRKQSVHRKQTYISSETYSKLARILPLLADGMTIPAFLDNVLEHHLGIHEREFEDLVRNKVRDIELNIPMRKEEQIINHLNS